MIPDVRPDGGDDGTTPSLDMVLELLSQYQRREILRYLRDSDDDVVAIGAVIDHLVDVERERQGDVPGEDHLLSVLVHVHGPKLEEAGVVEYDGRTSEIRYHSLDRVELALDAVEELAEEF